MGDWLMRHVWFLNTCSNPPNTLIKTDDARHQLSCLYTHTQSLCETETAGVTCMRRSARKREMKYGKQPMFVFFLQTHTCITLENWPHLFQKFLSDLLNNDSSITMAICRLVSTETDIFWWRRWDSDVCRKMQQTERERERDCFQLLESSDSDRSGETRRSKLPPFGKTWRRCD